MQDDEKVDPPLPGSGGFNGATGGDDAAKEGDPPPPDGDDTVGFQQPESAAPDAAGPEEVDPELPGSGG